MAAGQADEVVPSSAARGFDRTALVAFPACFPGGNDDHVRRLLFRHPLGRRPARVQDDAVGAGLPQAERARRHARPSGGVSAFAIVPGPNARYLTGLEFHLMERPTLLLLTANCRVLAIMPELERPRWREAFPEARTFYWQGSEGFAEPFRKLSVALAGPVGVEGLRMRMAEFEGLASHLPPGATVNADTTLAKLSCCGA
ncbi:MAG: hypothetical protein F4051_06635 [Boseongicola sp. SB0670_bin_30]|nr:hypothetical protein [Boseongicola sp. SB0670_bin_30]